MPTSLIARHSIRQTTTGMAWQQGPAQAHRLHFGVESAASYNVLILIGGLLYYPVSIMDCCLFCIISMRNRAFLSAGAPLPLVRCM